MLFDLLEKQFNHPAVTGPLIAIADTMLAQIPSSFQDMSTGRKNLSIGRKNAVTGRKNELQYSL
jgi:hypothetical protein